MTSCGTILWCVFKPWPLLLCCVRTGHSSRVLGVSCDAKCPLGGFSFLFSAQAIRSQIHKPHIWAGAIVGAVGSGKSCCVFDLFPCDPYKAFLSPFVRSGWSVEGVLLSVTIDYAVGGLTETHVSNGKCLQRTRDLRMALQPSLNQGRNWRFSALHRTRSGSQIISPDHIQGLSCPD